MTNKITAKRIEPGLYYAREIDEPIFFIRVDDRLHIWEIRQKIDEGTYKVLNTCGSRKDCVIWLELNYKKRGLTYLYANQHLTNKEPVYDGDN